MIGFKIKTFWRPAPLFQAVERANRRFLFKAGAAVRTVAMKSIRRSKRPSRAGQPPRTRKGRICRAIVFAVDLDRQSVVIGPMASRVGQSAKAHEYGGKYKKQTFPARPFMGPARKRVEPHTANIWADAFK